MPGGVLPFRWLSIAVDTATPPPSRRDIVGRSESAEAESKHGLSPSENPFLHLEAALRISVGGSGAADRGVFAQKPIEFSQKLFFRLL